MATNPYQLESLWRDIGEAREERERERLKYGGGQVTPVPENPEVRQHERFVWLYGGVAQSLIHSRDDWMQHAKGTHWAWETNPEPQEIRDLFKLAADSLGAAINQAVEKQLEHRKAAEALRQESGNGPQ